MAIKLLIGGSPCTYWSCAQKNNRETTAEGLGWELFKNYLIAKEKFKPDFFLYENNKSAAQAIKDQIKHELGVWDGTLLMRDTGARYIEINSALVSAQNRQRFYVHNCGEVGQPEDRGILLKHILEKRLNAINVGEVETIQKAIPKLVKKYGYIPTMFNAYNTSFIDVKSPTLSRGSMVTSSCATTVFAQTNKPVYEVKDGLITIKGKQYPIKLPDGYYIIRKLTVTECCRLQGMPDWWFVDKDGNKLVSDSQAYKGLGNGWQLDTVKYILEHALNKIPKDEPILLLSMYDGIGTGRRILEELGFENVKYYAYEIDKYCISLTKYRYPDVIHKGDAFKVRNAGEVESIIW